jgi:hypothetical protein
MLRPPPYIHRFLLTSSASFVGEYESESFLITPAFPDFSPTNTQAHQHPGPHQRSLILLTLRISPPEHDGSKAIVQPDYQYLANHICILLTVFYGKFIESCGYTERCGLFCVPSSDFSPQRYFQAPPFSSTPRASTGIYTDLNGCSQLLERFLHLENENPSPDQISLLRSSSFYHASLRLFASDPILAFTLLLSALEALIPLFTFSEEEIFDPQLISMLNQIAGHVPDSESIVTNLKGRLFQVRKKCSLIAQRSLDTPFFARREAVEEFQTIKADEVEGRVKAAYDLRSMFLHTGRSHGVWVNAFQNQNSEIIVGEPVIEDADLKKLIVKAPTLAGLERIVHYCLYRQVRDILMN